ncbi:MAG: toll/interleukin-1 receptor domain-containing protein, partial [Spirochaetaceae bacterium]|nr:toll/interleukin-1 receptor domain-containing protein [Spirochaetaceae bacterium]
MEFDVFISHAGEDKQKIVRRLAERLRAEQIEVWYDEWSLVPGSSLRRSIDNGLRKSRFGVVILSPAFFRKAWPQWELDGLVQMHNSSNSRRIIPVWHDVGVQEVAEYSPPLADIVAIPTTLGVDFVAQQILKIVRPMETTIAKARRILNELGYDAPPPADEWWIDVIEYDGSDGNVYDWPFYTGNVAHYPDGRGEILASKAIQRKWQEVISEQEICQITHPERLHAQIESVPGLVPLLMANIGTTIIFAPQLTIRGFGGPFENEIEERYIRNKRPRSERQGGTALTKDGLSPGCDTRYALRDPEFGYYQPSYVTSDFVLGESTFGPSAAFYEIFEYLVWLLSDSSLWLPPRIRGYLTSGFEDWTSWVWTRPPARRDWGLSESSVTGSLFSEAADYDGPPESYIPTGNAVADLCER